MGTQATAFEKLHPHLQRELHAMRWEKLRPIQVDAIHVLMDTHAHVILRANTAGGKTEAAFLPILSQLAHNHGGGVRALYVGPLKALINDQFRRLEDLCQRAEIPVHRWHGDVGRQDKSALLAQPGGVLLITPESIESLFINHPAKLSSLFGRLGFIVIDELHAFMGTERGAHLRSLLYRLSARAASPPRKVGLSATLGDIALSQAWLDPASPDNVTVITGDSAQRELRFRIHGYEADARTEPQEDAELERGSDLDRLGRDLMAHLYGKNALVFANSRARLEECADEMRRRCEREDLPDRVRIHHGSLSKAVREEAEEVLREGRGICTFCTTTLEMGIDVGSIECVGQIEAPASVNALTQRIGRSGRGEDQPQVMRMYVLDKVLKRDASIVERLRPGLVQAVAVTELMLEKWCEPPQTGKPHLSTLVQQVLSVIRERGGTEARQLYQDLVLAGGFRTVSKGDFAAVLRSMGAGDLIEQSPEGRLILGLAGEKIVQHYDFYSAFQTADEFHVLHQGHAIGSIAMHSGLDVDMQLILAGRRWRITAVSLEDQCILVEPSRGGRLPAFNGSPGGEIHGKVREKMKRVLLGTGHLAYLDGPANRLLEQARAEALSLDLARFRCYKEGKSLVWFTWTGSRINHTLFALLKHFGGFEVTNEGIALLLENVSGGDLAEFWTRLLESPPESEDVAAGMPLRTTEKYDRYLDEALQIWQYAHTALDLPGALALASEAVCNHFIDTPAHIGSVDGPAEPEAR